MAADAPSILIGTASPGDTMGLGERIGLLIRPGDILLLHGELGSGKTCFVRGLARGMGIDPGVINSPTFVVVNEYEAPPGRPHLVHMDAYRLAGPQDLDALGLEESVRGGALVVEWAERVAPGLGRASLELRFRHEGEDRRSIRVEAPDPAWAARLGDLRSP